MEIEINGVTVKFPFEPYKVQKDYMAKVIECLNNQKNGILESPTGAGFYYFLKKFVSISHLFSGTGKTLSLLCSSLAWLTRKKAQSQADLAQQLGQIHQNDKEQVAEILGKAGAASHWGAPKIIYASRTHSQLSQAMQELKKTAYNHVKAVSLGSRDQLCIHPEVQKEVGNSNKMHMCRLKVDSKQCGYYSRVEKMKDHPDFKKGTVVDIEDLVKFGQKHRACSYFLSREMVDQADIIFMPYNYLLDPKARKSQKINLNNTIVILDEAHNVEKMCEESASVQISSSEIAVCIEDITAIMKKLNENNEIFNNVDEEGSKDFSLEDLAQLKEMMLNFEKVVDELEIKFGGATFEGSYIFQLLQKANINHSNASAVSGLMDSLVQFLLQSQGNQMFGMRRGVGLMKMNELLTVAFVCKEDDYKTKMERSYKVHVELEDTKAKPKAQKQNDGWMSKGQPSVKSNAKLISFWCFNPGFGMDQLLGHSIHSIILTSGTLAPLKPLISELGLPVSTSLENPHIIGSSQVCVKIVSCGPDKEPLISNYANRDNPKYVASLGRTILSFCPVVPHGLLVFFPSYPLLQKCQEAWQESGLWSQISRVKPIFVEPRSKDAFVTTMVDYYAKVNEPESRGAIFMAVCRGKVSEGLDFADNNGRAVIITGLPFPPLKDPRVILKKKYLDDNRTRENGLLTGNDWYSLEATRAVNQAIGRVIRHKDDYGAILLCDARFNNQNQKNQLSSWIQSHLKLSTNTNFGPVIGEVSRFFRNCEKTLPAPKAKPLPSDLLKDVDDSSSYSMDFENAKKKLQEINKNVIKIENANEIYSWKKPDFNSEDLKKFIKVKEEPVDLFSGLERNVEVSFLFFSTLLIFLILHQNFSVNRFQLYRRLCLNIPITRILC